ncbi:MAG: hypothetical protein BGO90_03890 [Legionella sp. 40-6]|nr:MAG: hypothetical protein BGO90_03890 [Legionella sp. 40-6]
MPRYRYDLSKVYLIWFSHYPDQALGIENELRLIRLRQQNPQTDVSLIYSARLLTPLAIASLRTFCDKHAIDLYDFDTEIMSLLSHHNDIRMYQIARKELIKTQRQQGGNFSAASDCLRLIVPVIAKLGIYMDFDVPCAFANTTETTVDAEAPLLLTIEGEYVFQGLEFHVYVNTDFLACAFDENNPVELDKDALKSIRCNQDRIIKNYEGKLTIDKLFHPIELTAEAEQEFNHLFGKFLKSNYPQSPFGLRKFILEFSDSSSNNKASKHNLMMIACSRISGPSNFWSLYSYAKPTDDIFTFGVLPVLDVYDNYIKLILASNAAKHPIISKCVTFTNTHQNEMEYVKKHGKNPAAGVLADLSWTEHGKLRKEQREAAFFAATIKIQRFFRNHREGTNKSQPLENNHAQNNTNQLK